MIFRDRFEAGEQLASALLGYRNEPNLIVLALPRGGVPVAFPVAKLLPAPLDIFLVRKLGAPYQPELAMGAIASGGVIVLNQEVVNYLGITEVDIKNVIDQENKELQRREYLFRGDKPEPIISNRVVIIIDDGLATGSTMRAAVLALRKLAPARIVVAVPVGASSTCREFRKIADDVVCLATPENFQAVGQWYQDFAQTTDEEVIELLRQSGDFSTPINRAAGM